jgi:signal transduction histidine kinase
MRKLDRVIAPGTARNPFNTRDALVAWMDDLAPYGVFTTDRDLVVRSWNQWMVTHSRLGSREVKGRSLLELYPGLIARRLDEHFARALNGEVNVLSAALHRHLLPFPSTARNDSLEHMLQTARIAPLRSGHEIIGTITIVEDVTQRESQAAILRRQQEHDRVLSHALALLLQSERPHDIAAELFPHLSVPLKLDAFFNYLLAPDGRELRLHAAGGITPEVRKAMSVLALGESFCGQIAVRRTILVENHAQDNLTPTAECVRRLGLRSYVGFPLLIGDRLLGTLSFGSYARDVIAPDEVEVLGKIANYVAISLDRSQRAHDLHEAQERLSRHAEDLEAKVAERTARLHETIAQLESFSYTIAHDLRAPIRSLTGFTDILLSDHSGHLPEDAQALLRRLQRASHRLDALTRDLLKFSRIGRQDVKLAPVDLHEMVQDIVSVTPALQEGVLTIQPPLGFVCAQRTLLQQCLSNLFDNALKFTKPGTKATVMIRTEVREAPVAATDEHSGEPGAAASGGETSAHLQSRRRIWVEDNGIGIAAQAHEKIFGIFERIPGPTPVEGTGIGLAILARACEQMNGTYGVESAPGEGSRFWLEFDVPEKPELALR